MPDRRSSPDFENVAPDASALFESMRGNGYDLPTAIADLIDNSVSAGCRNVWVDLKWDGEDSWISITDDGDGMTERELSDAMRLGSMNPLLPRDKTDLGRFGLGMKTASLSQAKRLTVISRGKSGRSAVRRWDLDHLAIKDVGWELLKKPHEQSGKRAAVLKERGIKRGTQVLLENLDRVLSEKTPEQQLKDQEDYFLKKIEQTRRHLGMVFHRFISRSRNRVKIFINDDPVEAWDPFLEDHAATIPFEKETFERKRVTVQGFVLPHYDRFKGKPDVHKRAGGPGGWNAQQGFYVYRADRMIISGSWLDLKWQQEEHYKLARIALDIPNSMDAEWRIDVKKSVADPPATLRRWLLHYADAIRNEARAVYAHRGKYGARKKRPQTATRPWKPHKSGADFYYRIDRKNPVIAPLIRTCSTSARKETETLLRLIEETVPVQQIWIDTADNQEGVTEPFGKEKRGELSRIIRLCYENLMQNQGMKSKKAIDHLAAFDGFQSKEALAIIGELREKVL